MQHFNLNLKYATAHEENQGRDLPLPNMLTNTCNIQSVFYW